MAEKGNWKGGYREDGGYDGVSEYDRDGNYVGTLEDDQASAENSGDGTDSEDPDAQSTDTEDTENEEDSSDSSTDSTEEEADTAVIRKKALRIMMKIRTAITVMSPIMSKDKKAFLIYSTGIWTFCQRLFCKCFG